MNALPGHSTCSQHSDASKNTDESSCPAAVQQRHRVLELRVHYAEHVPRPLAGIFVEIRMGKEVHRSRPVSVEEGVAPFNSWGRLPCDDDAQLLHFRVRERYSSKAHFWLAPLSMATRHGTVSLDRLLDVEASDGAWIELSVELHSQRSTAFESMWNWARCQSGWLPRRASGLQPVRLVVEARMIWQASTTNPHEPLMPEPATKAAEASAAATAAAAAASGGGEPLPEMALGCSLQRAAHAYGHGGFMGMALSLMHDTRWVAILQALDPALYDDGRLFLTLGRVPGKDVSAQLKLMTLLENSPVCCAYGLVRSGCTSPVKAAAPTSLMHTSIAEAEDENEGSQSLDTLTASVAAAADSQQGADPSAASYDPAASAAAQALEAVYAESNWQESDLVVPNSSSHGFAGRAAGRQLGRPLSGIMPPRWQQLIQVRGQSAASGNGSSTPSSPFAAAATATSQAVSATAAGPGNAQEANAAAGVAAGSSNAEAQPQTEAQLRLVPEGPCTIQGAARISNSSNSGATASGIAAKTADGESDMLRSPSGTQLLRLNSSTQAFMRLNNVSMRRVAGSRLASMRAHGSGGGSFGVGSAGAAVRWVDVARVRAQSGGQPIRMLATAHRVNRFGYRPIGLEWDTWLSPDRPWDISAAKVDHGTAGQLVLQAVTTGMGLKRLAKKVGESQIRKHGTAPDAWLSMFGRALNLALHGNEDVPLELQGGQQEEYYELLVDGLDVEGLSSSSAATFNIKAEVHGNGHRVAPHHLAALTPDEHLGSLSWSPQLAAERNARRSSSGAQAGPGGGQGKRKVVPLPEHVAFWPLTQQLEGSELLVQLFSRRKRLLGVARLHLQELAEAAEGACVELTASLEPAATAGRLFSPHHAGHHPATCDATDGRQAHRRDSKQQSAVVGAAAGTSSPHGMQLQSSAPSTRASEGQHPLQAPQQLAAPSRSGDITPAVELAFTSEQDTTKSLETGQSATVGPADSTLSDDAGGYGIWEDMANPRHSNIGISILPMPLNIPSTWRADAATAPSAANGGSAAAAATAAAATAADDGGDYGAGDDDDDDDAGTVTSSVGLLCGGAVVRVKLRLRRVGVLQAAQERLGLPEAAARSCIAMLSAPGGLFLDVKSAYSKPRDLEQFCASLAGVGIHVKAVCSFSPKQLAFPSRGGPVPRWDNIRFFHGLNGLENACLDGNVPRGQAVLFNGASLLLGDAGMFNDEGGKAAGGAGADDGLAGYRVVDEVAWLRYRAVVDEYDVAGGIYVQEPDAGPASVHALVQLVNDNPAYLPLGFAYGHLGDTTLPFFEVNGKGFAAQSVIEELQARRALSSKAKEAVRQGKHRSASRFVVVAYGRRLLAANRLLRWADQSTFLYLLGDFQPAAELPRVVDEMCGIKYIFMRFWKQYDEFSPLTLLEQGFNLNETKSLLRMLRNRGVLAALPLDEKIELGVWLTGRALYGSATWLLQWIGVRQGLHKLAKEALVCLLESCTQEEFNAVVAAVTNDRPSKLWLKLRGWTYVLSWSYMRRVQGVIATHQGHPDELAYLNDGYGYKHFSRVPLEGLDSTQHPGHTRDKRWWMSTWRAVRKSGCCLITVSYNCCLCLTTLGLWNLCCLPRLLRPYCANIWLPLIAALVLTAFLLAGEGILISAIVYVVRLAKGQGLLPGCSLSLDTPGYNNYICNGTTIATLYVNGSALWANGSCLTGNDAMYLFPGEAFDLQQLPGNGTACFVNS